MKVKKNKLKMIRDSKMTKNGKQLEEKVNMKKEENYTKQKFKKGRKKEK